MRPTGQFVDMGGMGMKGPMYAVCWRATADDQWTVLLETARPAYVNGSEELADNMADQLRTVRAGQVCVAELQPFLVRTRYDSTRAWGDQAP